MRPRDAFGVLVRAAGLGFLLAALIDIGHFTVVLLGLPTVSKVPQAVTATSVAFWAVMGTALIVSARSITRLVYGRDDHSS